MPAPILADVLRVLEGELRPGVTTAELDAIAERMIRDAGATPSFLGYGGSRGTIPFPGSICVSINDEVVHGIPSGEAPHQRGRRRGAGHRLHLAGLARRHRPHLRGSGRSRSASRG